MYHIVVNPASRSGRGKRIWEDSIQPRLQRENAAYNVFFSEQAGDVAKLAGQIASSMTTEDVLILLGGDGTVNEALQGIENFENVTFGYIPTGSSNDLARDIGIPKDPEKALDLILHGKPTAMDMGVIRYADGSIRRFAVSCGIGFDAAVCEEALHSRMKVFFNKIGLGKLTYMGVALKQIVTAKKASCELTLEDSGEPIRIQRFLFVAGMVHRYEGGGFKFCPDADPTDGMLNLCAVGDIPKPLVLAALPTAFFGKHYIFKGLTPYRASHYTIKSSVPLWVHTDGEVNRQADSFSVSCVKGALRMIRS